MQYIPIPTDTEEIKLPDEIKALIEETSADIHAMWAQGRVALRGKIRSGEEIPPLAGAIRRAPGKRKRL